MPISTDVIAAISTLPAAEATPLRQQWHDLVALRQNDAADMLVYFLVYFSHPECPSPRKPLDVVKAAFSPVSNPSKLAGGRKPYDTLESLLHAHARFGLTNNFDWNGQHDLYPQSRQLAARLHMELRSEKR